jgi:UTP--glucose-1-phosphate uridylyltransferase
MTHPVRKAVIPAAGFGTRFLPATKAQPKEMLPVVDKPTIQYVVEEAAAAGITDILIIIGRGKQSIVDHFDRAFQLEQELQAKSKLKQLESIRALADMATIHYVRQNELNGLGDAVRYARMHVGDEPFVVLLGDTIVKSQVPATRQLIDAYNEVNASVIGVERVPRDKVDRYGIVSPEQAGTDAPLQKLKDVVEKPRVDDAPSDLAICGRYVFDPAIFDSIDRIEPGVNNELQLTDAIRHMMQSSTVYSLTVEGTRYDIGSKLDFLITTVEFALERSDLGPDFRTYLKSLEL